MIVNPYRFATAGGSSRIFDGVNDFLTIPDFTYDTSNLTVMCWLKSTDTNFNVMFSHWDLSSQKAFILSLDSTDHLLAGVSSNGSVNKLRATKDPAIISDGTWHHVAFTFATSNTLKLYVDGDEKTDLTVVGADTTTPTIHNSTADLTIGARLSSGTAGLFIDSKIADCRIYDATLSEANINTIYTGGTYTTDIVGQWLIDDTLDDQVGTNDASEGSGSSTTTSTDFPL
jgi:hypothetical protein